MGAWERSVEARLGDRPILTEEQLCERFWPDLPAEEVREALQEIVTEWRGAIGLLRPEDRLNALFAAPRTRNPLRWMEYQVRSSDGLLEISSRLSRRLKASGLTADWGGKVFTVEDLVQAWCAARRHESK